LKLHTNGVESQAYESADKDTWAGATFTESELRELARELGARLVSVYGAGTIYCWTTIRKPLASPRQRARANPKIEFHARSDDAAIKTIPSGGDEAWLSLVVTGLDREVVDANNLKVVIADRVVTPRYVGRIRPHFENELNKCFGSSLDHLTYIEAGVPAGVGSGGVRVRIKLDSGETSSPYAIEFGEPQPVAPIIVTVRNGADYGTDIHARGPKSSLRLFVEGLDETANCDNVRVKVGARTLVPTFAGFVTDIAGYQVDAQLPPEVEAGLTNLAITFNGLASKTVPLKIEISAE
jgi:hypothetical protein